jgi:hypothetical protein
MASVQVVEGIPAVSGDPHSPQFANFYTCESAVSGRLLLLVDSFLKKVRK